MLLKSIKLKNFRQFIDTELQFSTDKEKKVTFVLANNFTGKTTITSAFTWCLFGKAGLPNGVLLNRKVQNSLKAREEVDVEVEVELQYGKQDYCIKRVQTYANDQSLYGHDRLQAKATSLYITYKDPETGLTKAVDENKVQDMMNLIIPQDLADYFFMKAEQINAMGRNIQNRSSSDDFATAVKKILGMQAVENAVKHLVKQQGNSVQALFQKKYNGNANAQIEKLQAKLNEIRETIRNNEEAISKAEDDIKTLNSRNVFLTTEIKKWAEGAKRQHELDIAQNKISSQEALLKSSKTQFFNNFARELPAYCMQHIVPEVLSKLKETKIEDKNIPNVNNKTIEFLLKRGECICGHKLEIGSEEHSNLVKLLDYVPPKYIGATISEYIAEAKARTDKSQMPNLALEMEQFSKLQLGIQTEIDESYENIEKLRKLLTDHKDTAEYENERSNNEETIQRLNRSIVSKKTTNVQLESEFRAKEKELDKVSQEDSANKHVNDCINHVRYIAKVLETYLVEKEDELRTMMIDKMNEIFASVFTSSYKINLSERYLLSITDNSGTPQDIDTSGAQSVFVVLAFITSVLYLAKEIHDDKLKNKNAIDFLHTEPYPLVLDAPFSAFSTDTIEPACLKLPGLTEQIIIFSKDTEGELIKQHMKDKIGKYYIMKAATLDGNARDVLETNVEEGDINAASI